MVERSSGSERHAGIEALLFLRGLSKELHEEIDIVPLGVNRRAIHIIV